MFAPIHRAHSLYTTPTPLSETPSSTHRSSKLYDEYPNASTSTSSSMNSTALTLANPKVTEPTPSQSLSSSLIEFKEIRERVKPEWHAPWKLSRVISGHIGAVRAVAVDPTNDYFATGASDRIVKIWDLATGDLRVSLTGHVSTVRGLCISDRHPYLWSAGEDKMIKCWDLEQNKVVRHYHGHLSGIFSITLHPTLDVLVSTGRDGTARVWDMRTRAQVEQFIKVCFGEDGLIEAVCRNGDPQIATCSADATVRLWDLAAGKSMTTLTHHKKAIRALTNSPTSNTLTSASPDAIKQFAYPNGTYLQSFLGHQSIINTLATNYDGVMFSGADNGGMYFWDEKTGYNFQCAQTRAQPGSLDSEAGIYCSTFDMTGTRLITGEADKSIKIWREDGEASQETHPVVWEKRM